MNHYLRFISSYTSFLAEGGAVEETEERGVTETRIQSSMMKQEAQKMS